MHSHLRWTVSCCLLGLSALGCTADVDGGAPEVEMAQQTLAEIDLGSTRISFVEQRAGFPLVIARGAGGGANPLRDPALRGKNVVEIYEHLTREPAPPALEAALDRARAVAIELEAGEELDPSSADVPPASLELVDKAALSAQQFFDEYCNGSPSTQICNLNVTGTGEYNRYTPAVWGYVNPYRGTVKIQIRVKFITGWENVYVTHIPQFEEFDYMKSYVINREMKVKVFEADGDGYHWGHGWI